MRERHKTWKNKDKIYSYLYNYNGGCVVFSFMGTEDQWKEFSGRHEDKDGCKLTLVKKRFLCHGHEQNKHEKKLRKKIKSLLKDIRKK